MSAELVDRFTLPPPVVNPFVNDIAAHHTPLQYLKMTLVAGTIFPFRLVGFIVCILIAFVAGKVALWGLSEEEWLMKPMRQGVAKKVMFAMSRCCMFALGYQWLEGDASNYALRSDGRRQRAPMIVVNHSTVTDGFLLFYLHGLMSVGIDALAEAPIFGTFARAGQAFSLNRDDAACKKKIAAEIQRRVTWTDAQAAALGEWPPFVVFAEGTCTNQKSLIQFRHGAFLPGVPVQPMIVRYPYRYCDQSWCGLSNPVPVLVRMMLQLHNRLEYSYLPVYEPNEAERQDPYLFAENVRRLMAEALKTRTTEHTYEDMRLAGYAEKRHKIPWRTIHAEMGQFRALGCTYDDAKKVVDQFASLDRNRDGVIDRAEFLEAWFGPTSSSTKSTSAIRTLASAIFDCVTTRSPLIDFRTFFVVVGLRRSSLDNDSDHPTLYMNGDDAQRASVNKRLIAAWSQASNADTLSHSELAAGLERACRGRLSASVASVVADEWLAGKPFITASEWHTLMVAYPMLPEFLLFSLKIA